MGDLLCRERSRLNATLALVATANHTVHVASPPDSVWWRLQQAETWEALGPVNSVWDADHDASGILRSYRWAANAGPQDIAGTARTTSAERDRHFEMELAASGITGSLRADIMPNSSGCDLTVTLTLQPEGFLLTAVFPIVARAITSGLPRQVEEFAAAFGGQT